MLGSGNLGLISLMEERRRLTLEEIDERHPRLIPALREHPHVGWILVRSSERGAVALGAAGAHYLAEGAVEGEDPLASFAPNAPRHLLRTDGFAHVADIMVGSFYDPELEEGCAFEELISFHGGIGGPQTRAVHPPSRRPPAPRRGHRRRRAGASRALGLAAAAPGRRSRSPPPRSPRDEPRLGGAHRRRCSGGRGGGDAARAAARSRGQPLHRRRPGLGSLRRAGDRILGAARLRRLPRLRELRPVAGGSRAGSARAGPAGRDRSVPGFSRRPRADRRAGVLRPVGRARRVAAHGVGHPGRCDQPVGSRAVPHLQDGSARDAERGSGLRQVDRPDVGPRSGPDRPDPRSRRRDPAAAVGGAAPHLLRGLRVHAVLRRQRRGRGHTGGPDGLGRHRRRLDAAADRVPRQPVPRGSRRRASRGDGENAADRRRGARRCRRTHRGALRRTGNPTS